MRVQSHEMRRANGDVYQIGIIQGQNSANKWVLTRLWKNQRYRPGSKQVFWGSAQVQETFNKTLLEKHAGGYRIQQSVDRGCSVQEILGDSSFSWVAHPEGLLTSDLIQWFINQDTLAGGAEREFLRQLAQRGSLPEVAKQDSLPSLPPEPTPVILPARWGAWA